MKQVTVTNFQGVITHGPINFDDPTSWINDQVTCNAWGLPDRWVLQTLLTDDDKVRATNQLRLSQILDLDGNPISEVFVPASYTVSVVDLSQNYDYLLQQCYENRRSEYPPMADYLDAIVKGDTAQSQTYISACLAVKAKYPKPTQS